MRNNGRDFLENRSEEYQYHVAKHAKNSVLLTKGLTKVQVNLIAGASLNKILSPLNLNNWTKRTLEVINRFLAPLIPDGYYLEQFILSADGNIASCVLHASLACLDQLKQTTYSGEIKALTIGVLNQQVMVDLDANEEQNCQGCLFILQKGYETILDLALKGELPLTEVHNLLHLSQGVIDQMEITQPTNEMKNDEIVIATSNLGKAQEFKLLFEAEGYQVKTLQDFNNLPEIIENGKTFTENATIKAETISQYLNLPVLGDDSGLCVDALQGLPGIYSARFARDHDDAANNAKLLSELADVPSTERTARFHTSLVFAAPGKENLVVEGEVEGLIASFPEGTNGFGYDPLFYLPELDCTMAQLTIEQKNQLSHRAEATRKLAKVWKQWLVGE